MALAEGTVELTIQVAQEALSDNTPVYVATCTEINVASQGTTLEEATENITQALHLWFQTASQAEVEAEISRLRRKNEHVYTTRIEVPYGQVAGAIGR